MEDLTPGRKFYNDQIAYLEANDVDGLIENHYDVNGSLIGFGLVVTGHGPLREQFRRYLSSLGGIKLKSTDQFVETPGAIFFQATITGNQGDIRVCDAFVLKGEKILYHFTGVQ